MKTKIRGRVMGRGLIGLLLLLVPLRAAAQRLEDYDYENLRFRGIGAEVGYVLPWNIEPTVSYGLRGDMGFAGPHVRIVPAIRYWTSELRDEEVDRLATQFIEICSRRAPGSCPGSLDLGEVRRSDLELSLDAHVVPDVPTVLVPYAGAGVGLHLLNGGGEAIDGTFVEDLLDTVAPGINLLGGVMLDLGFVVQFSAEARLALTSDVQYGTLLVGGVWNFPPPPAAIARRGAR
ncbi:MAG TPA: hypothetical protein VF167_11705 [Longimicrobiaceae bacterium]